MPDDTPRAKRPVSDRRKQQNVRAQQNYRIRQKRRIEELEELLTAQDRDSSSGHGSGSSSTDDVNVNESDIAKFIEGHVGALDTDVTERLASREISLQDILRAGLDALQGSSLVTSPKTSSSDSSVTRTDKIIVLRDPAVHALPDIHANRLQIKQVSLVAAFRANAEHLGILFNELVNPDSESPFYVEVQKEMSSVTGHRPSELIKPCLQPTASQRQRPHHPWIDVLPCATTRQRCIELMATDPPVIDEWELCNDIGHGGLICWGSSGGEFEATGYGAPWDIRSWEAQSWFLKKWWFLVGGEDGPFAQQSRWWCEFRGDRKPCM